MICQKAKSINNSLARGSVLRILDSKSEVDQKFIREAPLLNEYLSKDARHVSLCGSLNILVYV